MVIRHEGVVGHGTLTIMRVGIPNDDILRLGVVTDDDVEVAFLGCILVPLDVTADRLAGINIRHDVLKRDDVRNELSGQMLQNR